MKTFYLKVGKEVINKVRAKSFEDAIEYFSKVKKMPQDELVKLFNITD